MTEDQRPPSTSPARDVLPSMVVFLIALPLSMGIALASGVPPAYGLITAIIGGITVGLLGGAPLQISGPSAGLAVLVWEIVANHGLTKLGAIVLVAAAVQITAGMLKFGRWFRAVSPAVIRGMLTGIGVLIIASQCHVMVDDTPKGSGLLNLISIPEAVLKGLLPTEDTVHHLAAMIGVATLIVLLLWDAYRPERLKRVPGMLTAAIVAAFLAWICELKIDYIAVPENLSEVLIFPGKHTLEAWADPKILWAGFALAFVASAETLLCATAVSKMHDGQRTDYNHELSAQGIGNLLCGLTGTIPITGVISRSTANVNAGATTRTSSVLHACWILLFVVLFPNVLALVPTSSLAAILVYIGYKLVNIDAVRTLSGYGKPVMAIFLATVVGIVALDLLTGILIGLGLSAARLIWSLTNLDVQVDQDDAGGRIDVRLLGSATFVGLPILAESLEEVPRGSEVHLHIEYVDYIDHACLDVISDWRKRYEQAGGEVVVEWDTLLHRYKNVATSGRQRRPEPPVRSTAEAPVVRSAHAADRPEV